MAEELDLVIDQGKTFAQIVRWETGPAVYRPITGVTLGAPTVLTVPAHGLADGWRFEVVSVKGAVELNSVKNPPKESDYKKATVIGPDTISINAEDSSLYSPYLSGGYVKYNSVHALVGFTARMMIKTKKGGTILETLRSADSDILIDTVNKTITVMIDAVRTAAYNWTDGVYDLEMEETATSKVSLLIYGKATVVKEVTTGV